MFNIIVPIFGLALMFTAMSIIGLKDDIKWWIKVRECQKINHPLKNFLGAEDFAIMIEGKKYGR